MAQVPAEKSYFSFAGGLNTDASPIGYPDETTQDEANFELLIDGSRKRRRGLDQESGGANHTLNATLGTSDVVTTHKWRNAGGLGTDFVVIQSGSTLYFFEDSLTPSANIEADDIDLLLFKVAGKADADVSQNPVSVSVGRNKLIVVGRYIQPIYLEWDGTNVSATNISIVEREFIGLDDGVANTTTPTGTITSSHKYNLFVRGWKQANITAYLSAKSVNPSKTMWPWKGYRRTVVAGITEEDGTWGFSPDKMESELFGGVSAPTGHLLVNPFDTTLSGTPSLTPITGLSVVSAGGYAGTWTVTSNGHGLSNGNQVVFVGTTVTGTFVAGAPITYTFNQTPVTISNVTANTFDFAGIYITSMTVVTYGSWSLSTANDVAINPTPFTTTERPQITCWYASRIWYLGIADTKLADKIYFSQVIEDETQLGRCYQAADPTDAVFNELVSTDGGYISISDIGVVKGAEVFNNALIVFSSRGVWEISGSNGVFAADNYRVRQISEFTCSSAYSIVKTGDSIFWTGHDGILKLFQDPQTGYLTVLNLSDLKIRVLWNSIANTEQGRVKSTYDHAKMRVYFLYQGQAGYNAHQYNHCLVYDVRLNAFYKLVFPTASANYIVDLFSISTAEGGEDNRTVKFVVQTNTRTILKICDMDQSDYADFDGNEQVPYLVTGYDNINDFQRFKQAPIIHVFMKKTETGYSTAGSDLVPVNPSSVLMRPIWDWSNDNLNSAAVPVGHYGDQWQVYRHRRYYQPVDSSDTFNDGFPVVVTRNKVRGRGRTLHLRFDGETAHDAHILGWAIHYKATRKI